MNRTRLPRRRHAITQEIETSNMTVTATVGLHPDTLRPMELFLTGAKDGTHLAAILDDASVVISIALQHGITVRELAHSVSPNRASVIGAALDLIAELGSYRHEM